MFDLSKGTNYMPLWEKVLVIFIVSISVSSLLAVSYRYAEKESGKNKHSEKIAGTVNIISRDAWGATFPISSNRFHQKPNLVLILETGGSSCFNLQQCSKRVRSIDRKRDITYNFLVGGDGSVYEGLGWNFTGDNSTSLGIAFIGDFNYKIPREMQIEATKELIGYGSRIGRIDKGYRVSAGNGLGEMMRKLVRTWDRWTETP